MNRDGAKGWSWYFSPSRWARRILALWEASRRQFQIIVARRVLIDLTERDRDPAKLVRKALRKNELDLLLVGAPRYRCLPRWSPALSKTDVINLLEHYYHCDDAYSREELRDRLLRAISKIVWTYEGLIPVEKCIVVEVTTRAEGKEPLGLPLAEIASELRQSIRYFAFRLEKDKTEEGYDVPEGRLVISWATIAATHLGEVLP